MARQTGKYPATDGTSIWSDVALPPTGEHYWECVFHCPPPDAGQPAASKGSALRGGFLIGVAKSTVTELDEDDEPVEVDRDCGREQYIFRLPGQWGLEDSASTNGGPLRGAVPRRSRSRRRGRGNHGVHGRNSAALFLLS